ncbi:hypothetical protein ACLK1G_24400 [Pseudomonas sp. NR3]
MPRSIVKENGGWKFRKNVSLATNGSELKSVGEKTYTAVSLELIQLQKD